MSNQLIAQPPKAQGRYRPATRHGDLIFTAGMTPRDNGVLVSCGKVTQAAPLESYREAVQLAVANALNAAGDVLLDQERIHQVLVLTVYIAAEKQFEAHSKIADFASDFLAEALGDTCIGSRAAIGVSSLPGNAPVEITLVVSTAC